MCNLTTEKKKQKKNAIIDKKDKWVTIGENKINNFT